MVKEAGNKAFILLLQVTHGVELELKAMAAVANSVAFCLWQKQGFLSHVVLLCGFGNCFCKLRIVRILSPSKNMMGYLHPYYTFLHA